MFYFFSLLLRSNTTLLSTQDLVKLCVSIPAEASPRSNPRRCQSSWGTPQGESRSAAANAGRSSERPQLGLWSARALATQNTSPPSRLPRHAVSSTQPRPRRQRYPVAPWPCSPRGALIRLVSRAAKVCSLPQLCVSSASPHLPAPKTSVKVCQIWKWRLIFSFSLNISQFTLDIQSCFISLCIKYISFVHVVFNCQL